MILGEEGVRCIRNSLGSPQRSPSSRVRRAIGRLNGLARSPGPLEESMSQRSAFGRPSDGIEALPEERAAPLTWEELFSVQTRASLELRVRPAHFRRSVQHSCCDEPCSEAGSLKGMLGRMLSRFPEGCQALVYLLAGGSMARHA